MRTSLALLAALVALTIFLPSSANAAEPFPGKRWRTASPESAGMNTAGLLELSNYVGGNGVVVRGRKLVHQWGNPAFNWDAASAAKPVHVHLLLVALQERRIGSLDEPVARLLPGLATLNPDLANKDRLITWRHLANQTSCYGATENPGTAFDYNDHQTALFVDALAGGVYGVPPGGTDERLFDPFLQTPLGLEDSPTLEYAGKVGRLEISARDFARFGLLYLEAGRWGARTLLAPDLVKLAVSSPLPRDLPRTWGRPSRMLPAQRSIGDGQNQEDHLGSYSFMWWTNRGTPPLFPAAPQDTFGAFGHSGWVALVVIPSLDVVVSWQRGLIPARPELFSANGRVAVNEALRLLLAAAGGSAAHTIESARTVPSLPKRDVKFGDAREIATGTQPHAALDRRGMLHVVFREHDALHHMTVAPDGEASATEVIPDSKRGTSARVVVDDDGEVHVVWDRRRTAHYARTFGGRWRYPVRLPQTYAERNLYPQIARANGELFASSWSITENMGADCLVSKLGSGDSTRVLSHGGCKFRPPALLGANAAAPGDGRPHAFVGLPHPMHAWLDTKAPRFEEIIHFPSGRAAEGLDAFFVADDPGVVSAWETSPGAQSFAANTLSRARQGRAPVTFGSGSGFPRAAYDPVSERVYVLYLSDDLAHLASWAPSMDHAESLGAVSPEPVSFADWRWRGRGVGAGAIVPRSGGGVRIVYSAGGKLYLSELAAEPAVTRSRTSSPRAGCVRSGARGCPAARDA